MSTAPMFNTDLPRYRPNVIRRSLAPGDALISGRVVTGWWTDHSETCYSLSDGQVISDEGFDDAWRTLPQPDDAMLAQINHTLQTGETVPADQCDREVWSSL